MINLVAPDLKKKLLQDYHRRRLVVVGYLLLIVLIVGMILLIVIYITTNYRRFSLEKVLLAESRQPGRGSSPAESQSIADINARLAMFQATKQMKEVPTFVTIVHHLIMAKTSEIKITAVNYSLNADNTANLNIRGISSSRRALVAYIDKLKMDKLFTTIDSPVSNLISGVGGSFNMTVGIVPSFTNSTLNNP